jgi:hypothetical protein
MLAADAATRSTERRDHGRAACIMYKRSFEIFEDMRNRGILNNEGASKLELVSREIPKYNSSWDDLAGKNGR